MEPVWGSASEWRADGGVYRLNNDRQGLEAGSGDRCSGLDSGLSSSVDCGLGTAWENSGLVTFADRLAARNEWLRQIEASAETQAGDEPMLVRRSDEAGRVGPKADAPRLGDLDPLPKRAPVEETVERVHALVNPISRGNMLDVFI